MRYAFMTFSTPDQTLEQCLDIAKQYGYDGIEPRMDSGHKHGIELDTTAAQRSTIAETAARSGIALCCLATSLRYGDPAQADEMIDDTHQRIDLAADCGIPTMRVFGGPFPDDLSREDAIEQVAGCLANVADHAAERDVVLCVETHDAWCDPTHLAAVIKTVNHPAVKVNWDIMHPVRAAGFTIDASFDTLKPWIRHIHFHDGIQGEKLQMVPIGEGAIDHKQAIRRMMELDDWNGTFSGEWIRWQPYDEHLPRELDTMKRYEAELSR